MKKFISVLLLSIVLFPMYSQESNYGWRKQLQDALPLYGHRNWILIVDMAYPLQSKPAIETVYTGEDQLLVVKTVLEAIDKAPHVYPEVFLDMESDYVEETEAPGMEAYKQKLDKLLAGLHVEKKLHEQLIAEVDEAAKTFNILVLKTNLTIPYTSVFLLLNCGYWNADQEKQMRERMKK
ncbi:MAG: hypothetical protein GXO83_11260 [Chlorobi bacterium]|nr:hypothetical protein [Chlorobiota bacterium]